MRRLSRSTCSMMARSVSTGFSCRGCACAICRTTPSELTPIVRLLTDGSLVVAVTDGSFLIVPPLMSGLATTAVRFTSPLETGFSSTKTGHTVRFNRYTLVEYSLPRFLPRCSCTVMIPRSSSACRIRRTWRSPRRALRAIAGTEGQHTPLSLAQSASASRTNSVPWSTLASSHTCDINLTLKMTAPPKQLAISSNADAGRHAHFQFLFTTYQPFRLSFGPGADHPIAIVPTGQELLKEFVRACLPADRLLFFSNREAWIERATVERAGAGLGLLTGANYEPMVDLATQVRTSWPGASHGLDFVRIAHCF